MEQKKLSKSEAGKLGSDATHRERHLMLVELSKHLDKLKLNYIQEQPTKTIQAIYDIVTHKNGSRSN